MIELLIVIAVIGILAIAVLAAINPIEQINRGRDTGSRSDAEQLIGAIDRFYAAHGYYPWMESPNDTDGEAITWSMVDTVADTPGCLILDKLGPGTASCTGDEEVKLSFINRLTDTSYNDLWIYNRGTAGDSVYACFMPKSGSFSTDATERCAATLPPDYPGSACANTTECGPDGNCSCLP